MNKKELLQLYGRYMALAKEFEDLTAECNELMNFEPDENKVMIYLHTNIQTKIANKLLEIEYQNNPEL